MKLKDAQKQKDKKQEELFKQASLHNCQIEEITKALADAKASNESLIEERWVKFSDKCSCLPEFKSKKSLAYFPNCAEVCD